MCGASATNLSRDVKQRTCFFGVACCESLRYVVLSEVCWSWLLWSIQRVCPSVSWYHYTPRHHFPLTGLAKPPFVAWGGANVNQDLYPKVLTVGCSLKVGDVSFYKQPENCSWKGRYFSTFAEVNGPDQLLYNQKRLAAW